MRILIHAVSAHDMGGAARHLMGFLPALERVGEGHEYIIYVNDRLAVGRLSSNFEIHRLPVQSSWQRLRWDQYVLPHLTLKERADIVLGLLSFASARPSCPQITFLRNPIHCPYYTMGLGPVQRLNVKIRRYFLYKTLRASKLVIAPSAATRDMVRQVHPELPIERFCILPHAFEKDLFFPSEDLPEDISALLPEKRLGDEVRLLYVGHLLPYKDFNTVLKATRLLADKGLRFKFYLTVARENWPAGFDQWMDEVSGLKLNNHIVILGRVPMAAVFHLYRRCHILWFPSLCETFGWPIIEAMSCGLPIVASDTPVNREMVNGAGLFYSPFDASAAAEVITQLINNGEERRGLGAIGRRRTDGHIQWGQYVQTILTYCKDATTDSNNPTTH